MKIRFLSLFLFFVFSAYSQEIIPFTDIQPKTLGKGYTVFEDTTISEFSVEIVGTRNVMMGDIVSTPIFIAKLSGGTSKYSLAHTGVIAGMSGSPVKINGKTIGAISLKMGIFDKDPVAGVTPIEYIENMEEIYRMAGKSGGTKPASYFHYSEPIPLILSSPFKELFSDTSKNKNFVARFFEKNFVLMPEATASNVSPEIHLPIKEGGIITVYLTRGDITIAATGTITAIYDSIVLALGHEFFGNGSTALPFSASSIITSIANYAFSYKLPDNSKNYTIEGAIIYDSPVGVKGIIGKKVKMIPVEIALYNHIDKLERKLNIEFAPLTEIVQQFLPGVVARVAINGQPKKKSKATTRGFNEKKGGSVTIRHYVTFAHLPPIDVIYKYNFKEDATDAIVWNYLFLDFYKTGIIFSSVIPDEIDRIAITIEYDEETPAMSIYGANIFTKTEIERTRLDFRPEDEVPIELKMNTYPDTALSYLTTVVPVMIPMETKEGIMTVRIVSGQYLYAIKSQKYLEESDTTSAPDIIARRLIEATNKSSNTKLFWYAEILLDEEEVGEEKKIVPDLLRWGNVPRKKIIKKTKIVEQEIALPEFKKTRPIFATQTVYISVGTKRTFFDKIFIQPKRIKDYLKKP
ncbi:MAG: hypothetical protein HYW78_03895 [Parcubacteria group bacterium]|nr:hypothetical protein [Parcubacteria group bacterium]